MNLQKNLLRLLNFADLENEDEIIERLICVGEQLFYHFRICAHKKLFRITAVELYLKQHPHLDDPTAHGHEEQMSHGDFYVHRYQNFRAPFRCGLDITCGSKKRKIYGGLLIRELDKIDGPSKALITLVDGHYNPKRSKKWSASEKMKLKKIKGASIFDKKNKIFLVASPASQQEVKEIFIGPRILTANQLVKHKSIAEKSFRAACWRTRRHPKQMTQMRTSCHKLMGSLSKEL